MNHTLTFHDMQYTIPILPVNQYDNSLAPENRV
jgi:hypothetical protein